MRAGEDRGGSAYLGSAPEIGRAQRRHDPIQTEREEGRMWGAGSGESPRREGAARRRRIEERVQASERQ